jgi:ankyrin repeat protein
MRIFIRYVLYLYVFIGFSLSNAGSYEDFFIAIEKDNAVIVGDLLERGFDPNTVNPDGQPALIYALREKALKVVDQLLEQPSTKIDVRTPQDESPLMLAALYGLTDVCARLVARDADVNKPGWTPLHYAATGGSLDVMQLLIENYAYIDAESPNGSTPLMLAAMYGTSMAVELLLNAGADSTLKNELGLTAVHFALMVKNQASADLVSKSIRARNARGAW